ncbi:hypothetical protein [Actinokineospora globicatena]|uniref:DUF3592 domain-containing protein n=1 Tax=Actinokineospora globicatena TaxID=103729 RepID=A0A9W6QHS2_9PSEU|nr:hypothetical protein [Actinokineospora globicatena]GLW89667.1 hypothetical protein Aglo03_04830 [Actinokineospora globicatena]
MRFSDRLGWHVTVALGSPLLVMGLLASGSYLTTRDSGGWPGTTLVVLGGLAWLFTIFPPSSRFGDGWFFASGVVLMFAMFLANKGIMDAELHDRGFWTTCTVLSVATRTTTSSHYTPSFSSDGTPSGGTWSDSTTYHYDHTLRCDADQVRRMTTDGSPAGQEGQRLEVTYDPSGVIGPKPSDSLTDGVVKNVAATALTVLAIGVRLGSVLSSRRGRGKRVTLFSRRSRSPRGGG